MAAPRSIKRYTFFGNMQGRTAYEARSEKVGLKALRTVSLVVDKSSDANVSKLMAEIKVPSNVVSDTALRGLAAKSQTGTHFDDANALASDCLMWAGHWSVARRGQNRRSANRLVRCALRWSPPKRADEGATNGTSLSDCGLARRLSPD